MFMKLIYGIFYRNLQPVQQTTMAKMHAALNCGEISDCNYFIIDAVGLGCAHNDTNNQHDVKKSNIVNRGKLLFISSGRLDNALEVCSLLNVPNGERLALTDGDIMSLAYHEWGDTCPEKLFGDWAFAAWHQEDRRLFVARDHIGNTSLYYYIDDSVFAFSSTRQALLDLNIVPVELDELYLAQMLISWTAYIGERTIQKNIYRLPPAHQLIVTPAKFVKQQYWYLEKTPLLNLSKREDYVSTFRILFDDAVRARLRIGDNCVKKAQIATTLSGGLDSSSIAVTAASILRNESKRLGAFTSIPLYDTKPYVGKRFGNELEYAEITSKFAGNIDLYHVTSLDYSPIQGIKRMLQIIPEPALAAANFYWILQLEQSAQIHGYNILLTGQLGNAGVSWQGDISSQPITFQIKQLGWLNWLMKNAKSMSRSCIPNNLLIARQMRKQLSKKWYRSSAIHPCFAERMHLLEMRMNDQDEQLLQTPLAKRLSILSPGRSIVGALHAEIGAAHGIEVRDPTADVRLLTFAFSIPDHIFIDPKSGLDRWLIREAMLGRLPEQVRLNRGRGRQNGDIVNRLRSCGYEIQSTLNNLSAGPAASYIDVEYLRKTWKLVQEEDTQEAFVKSTTILLRGIMAGIFINQFYD
jgi:asparagine synthase (glutamine-hydrolysing)